MDPPVALAAAFVGFFVLALLAYAAIETIGATDGPVLPADYNPERYAAGGEATPPERVGICEDCGVWTDPDRGFCPVCTGSVEDVVKEA